MRIVLDGLTNVSASWTRVWRPMTFVVVGQSMAPVLRPGDLVVVIANLRVRTGHIALACCTPGGSQWQSQDVGDISEGTYLIKRVSDRAGGRESEELWLLGDAPEVSLDSRQLGPCPSAALLGRVVAARVGAPWWRWTLRLNRLADAHA